MKYWMDYVRAAYEVVLHAEAKSSINLDHEVEAYVVHTFARYMEQPNIPTDAIAIKFMTAVGETGELRKKHLEQIAEECILIDGLCLNSRRWPSKQYYHDMGRLALENRAWVERPPELFYERISHEFTNITRILNNIKL